MALDTVRKTQGPKRDPTEDPRPQSPVEGGSRFLKKAHPFIANSLTQRDVVSSWQHSTTASLIRCAELERRHKQKSKSVKVVFSDISPPSEDESSSDHIPKIHMKSKQAVAVKQMNSAAERAPQSPHGITRSKSRASGSFETRSVKVVRAVSPDSDEEYMKKLLGDDMDSNILSPVRASSINTSDETCPPPVQRRPSSPEKTVTSQCPQSVDDDTNCESFDDVMKNMRTIDNLVPATSESNEEIPKKEDPRPQSPVEGGSRFLKKAHPFIANSLTQRDVVSSWQHSTTASLIRCAELERRHKQKSKSVKVVFSDISPPSEDESSSDHIPKIHMKSKQAVAVKQMNSAAERAPQSPHGITRSKSRASGSFETRSVKVVRAVSPDSDEEYMKKLLGDDMDSNILSPMRASSINTSDEACPPPVPGRRSSPDRTVNPQRTPSVDDDTHCDYSDGVLKNVRTIENLLPATSASNEETPEKESEMPVSVKEATDYQSDFLSEHNSDQDSHISEHLQLQGDEEDVAEEVPEEIENYESDFLSEHSSEKDSQISERLQLQGDEEDVAEEVPEEIENYESDFLSEHSSEKDSQISEHLQLHGDTKNNEDHSRSSSDKHYSSATLTSHQESPADNRSQDSSSSESDRSQSSCGSSRRPSSSGKVLIDASIQTQPLYTCYDGVASRSAGAMIYPDPPPILTHVLSADRVEALSASSPSMMALNELLKQQLAMTRRFIESSRHQHQSMMKNLKPNYKYTTLKDTLELIQKHGKQKQPESNVTLLTQNTLVRLHLSSGLGRTRHPP